MFSPPTCLWTDGISTGSPHRQVGFQMATQKYSKELSVLDAARERISFVFDHFKEVNVSIG